MEEDSPTSRREKRALLMAFLQSDAFGPASPVIESPPVEPQDFVRLVTTEALDDVPSAQESSRRASTSDSSSSSSGSSLSTNVSLKEGKRLFESRVTNVSRRLEKTQEAVPASCSNGSTSLNLAASVQPEGEEESLYMEEKTSFLDDDGPETPPVDRDDGPETPPVDRDDGPDTPPVDHDYGPETPPVDHDDASFERQSARRESGHVPPAIPRLNLQNAQTSSPSHKAAQTFSPSHKISDVEETPKKIGTQDELLRLLSTDSENRSSTFPASATDSGYMSSSASTSIAPARPHDDSSSSSEGLSDFSVPRAAAAALNRSSPAPKHKNTGSAGDKHASSSARGNSAAATRQSRTSEKLDQVIAEATKDLTFSPRISDLPPMYHEHHMRRQSQSPGGHKYHPAVEEASKELTFSPRIRGLPDMYRGHHEQRFRHRQRAISHPILSLKVRAAGGGVSPPWKGGSSSSSTVAHSFSFPARADCYATGKSRKFGTPRGRSGAAPFHARAMAWQNRLDMRMRDLADADKRQRDSECSFRPRILNRSRNVVNSSLASGVMKRNYRNRVVERYVEERDRKLEESCTFAPKINQKSRQLAEKWRRVSYQCHHAHTHVANQCPQVVAACCDDPSCADDDGKLSDCASVCSWSCSEVSSVSGASVAGGAAVAQLPVEFLNREERELEQSTFVPATNKVPGKMKKVSKYLEADVASRLYEKSPFLPRKKPAKRSKAAPVGQIGDKKSAGSNKEGKWKSFITRYEEDSHRREVNRKLLSQREANSNRPIVNAKSEAMATRRGKSFAERLDVHNEARAKLNEKIAALAAKETPFQPQLCPKTATILERALHDEDGNMLIRRRVSSFDEDLTFSPKVNVRKGRKISFELNSYLDKSPHERLATGARPFSPSRRASKVKALMRAVGKKSSDSHGAFMKVVNKKMVNSKAVVKSSDSKDREKETKSTQAKPDDASTAPQDVRKAASDKRTIVHVREPLVKTDAVAGVSEPAPTQRGRADDQADIDAIQRRSICALAPRMRVPACSDF